MAPSPESLLTFWKSLFLGLYIPVTYTVWTGLAAVSLTLFGRLDSGLFHLLNLAVHVFNCFLVFLITRRLLSLKKRIDGEAGALIAAAVFGSLVFGLHPVQVESVSWITDLKGLLAAFFSLGAIYFYLPYDSAGKRGVFFYCVSTGLFIAALLSKPSAVALPVMLFFILLWLEGRISAKIIYSLIPWGVVALALALITRSAQPPVSGADTYPWLIRPAVALDAMMFYAHKIFWPDILAIDYCRTPAYVIGLSCRNPYWLMLAPVIAMVWYIRRRGHWLALGFAFVAGILPVSGLLPFAFQGTSTVADRYLYLPMLVMAVITAAIIMEKPRPLIFSLFIMLVIFLGVKSFNQCREWKNTETVMGHALRYYPRSFRANLNYGIALAGRGDFERAISHFKTARRLKPDDPLPYYHLGLAYAGTGDYGLYERYYEKVMAMDREKAARLQRAAELFKGLNRSGTVNDLVGENRGEQEERI